MNSNSTNNPNILIINIDLSVLHNRLRKFQHMEFTVLLTLMVSILLFTYFPPKSISILSNDQLDSFFPYMALPPNIFETIGRYSFTITRSLDGVPLNAMALTEFDIARIIGSTFPIYWEISVFFFVNILSLYVTTYILLIKTNTILNKTSFAADMWKGAFAFAAFMTALYSHNAFILSTIVGFNLFFIAVIYSFKPKSRALALGLFLLAGIFGRFQYGAYFYIPAGIMLASIVVFVSRQSLKPLVTIALGTLILLICDYRLFLSVLAPIEISHRANWMDARSYSPDVLLSLDRWRAAFLEMWKAVNGETSHTHYQWNPVWISVWLPVALLFSGLLNKARKRALNQGKAALSLEAQTQLMRYAIIVLCMAFVLFLYGVIGGGLINIAVILNTPFAFERVIVALPFLSAMLVSTALGFLFIKPLSLRIRLASLCMMCLGGLLLAPQLHTAYARKVDNTKHHIATGGSNPFIPKYTIGTMYKQELYDAIKDELGPAWIDERVLTVAMHPMITAYNGFAHLDGYFTNYSERYQQEFLGVISPAFDDIGEARASYFTGWGNRLNVPIIAHEADRKIRIEIDPCKMADLGGTLLMSAAEIKDPESSGVVFNKIVEAKTAGLQMRMWLYRPDASRCAQAAE